MTAGCDLDDERHALVLEPRGETATPGERHSIVVAAVHRANDELGRPRARLELGRHVARERERRDDVLGMSERIGEREVSTLREAHDHGPALGAVEVARHFDEQVELLGACTEVLRELRRRGITDPHERPRTTERQLERRGGQEHAQRTSVTIERPILRRVRTVGVAMEPHEPRQIRRDVVGAEHHLDRIERRERPLDHPGIGTEWHVAEGLGRADLRGRDAAW